MARLVVLQIATRTRAAGDRKRSLAESLAIPQAESTPIPQVAGRFGRNRLQHYRIAYGSCLEAKTTVEILVLSGRLDRETGRRWWSSLHRVGGMLWGLMKSLQ